MINLQDITFECRGYYCSTPNEVINLSDVFVIFERGLWTRFGFYRLPPENENDNDIELISQVLSELMIPHIVSDNSICLKLIRQYLTYERRDIPTYKISTENKNYFIKLEHNKFYSSSYYPWGHWGKFTNKRLGHFITGFNPLRRLNLKMKANRMFLDLYQQVVEKRYQPGGEGYNESLDSFKKCLLKK